MNDDKVQKKAQARQKYNLWQCSGYMIGLAWQEREKKVLVLCLLQALFAVGYNVVNLYLAPSILATVERQAPFDEFIFAVALFVALIMLCSAFSSYISANTMFGRISVRCAIIAAINKKSCITSYPNITDERFLALRSKSLQAVSSNSSATEAVWNTLTLLLQNALGFSLYILLLSSLDIRLILIILATTLGGYFVNKRLTGYGYLHREEEGELAGRLWYQATQAKNYSAAKDIRIFGMKPWIEEITAKTLAAFTAFHRRANTVYLWGNILDLVLTFLRNAIAYAYLIHLVLSNGLSVADFLLFFSAVGGFTEWVDGILESLTKLYRHSQDISTVRECLDFPEPFVFEEGKSLPFTPDVPHEIRLENVSFCYAQSQEYTLRNINLTIHPGEKLAVVGLNGAGKTTLVKLICGFFDPTQGRVLLDGQDIKTYNRRDYYALFSAVFQDFSLLAATVATNVAQTEDSPDMELVQRCVARVGLTQKIGSLKDGIGTYLNRQVYEDAAELSGGELQRLMLARALYKKAAFIVLDEPTAALDPIAEADLYNKYNEMTQGHTCVYISHRLASTRFCDRILLIDQHSIAEEGTHTQLLERGGKYARLFEVQSKYYREGDQHELEKEAAELA